MPRIIFSALSFLRKPLRKQGIDCCEAAMSIADGATPADLLGQLGLALEAVEAVFINGKAGDMDVPLKDGDRVALMPPGTPGPYRVLLGMKNRR
jgi:molybdopterin converting factor small subunit